MNDGYRYSAFPEVDKLKKDLQGAEGRLRSIMGRPAGMDSEKGIPVSRAFVSPPSRTLPRSSYSPRSSYKRSPPQPSQIYMPTIPSVPVPPPPISVPIQPVAVYGPRAEKLFDTVEDFLNQRPNLNNPAFRERLARVLLPEDVHMLFTRRGDILRDFLLNLQEDRVAADRDIDDFLRRVIEMTDRVKDRIYAQIDNYAKGFEQFYDRFNAAVEEHLSESTRILQT